MKKYTTAMIALALAAVISLFLFGFESEPIDNLIHAPALNSGNGQIWNELEKSVGGKYVLKTPTDGTHRSALIYADLDSDEKDEAIVFYSPDSAKDSVYMQILTQNGDGWEAAVEARSGFSEIKQVEFADLDGNGRLEVVVGWGLQKSNIMQQLCIYGYDAQTSSLTQIFDEKYSFFGLFDFDSNGRSEIALVTSDLTTQPTVRKLTLFSYSSGSFESIAEIEIDPSIITVSALNFDCNKRTTAGRIYIDGYTADGLMSTDLLIFRPSGASLSRCYVGGKTVSTLAKRSANVFCSDINGDGIIEIPTNKSFEYKSESFSLIEWKSLSRNTLEAACCYYDNRENGYYFKVPQAIEKISYPSLSDGGKRLEFYLIDTSAALKGNSGLLFEIFVDSSDTVSLISTQYRFLESHKGSSYYCRITEDGNELGITKKLLTSSVVFV